jgi:hypothetical protein
VILALIILAGILTGLVPGIEVLVDLHGWQVATVVLGGIIAVRLFLAPYWIWKEDQNKIEALDARLGAQEFSATEHAAKEAALDDIANEISWAVNNLVNPTPYPLGTSDPNAALDAWEQKYDKWLTIVSKKLENRKIFTAGDQAHFRPSWLCPSHQ